MCRLAYDPTKVSRIALENPASIAGMMLTTECVIADKPKKEDAHAGHGTPDTGEWEDINKLAVASLQKNTVPLAEMQEGFFLHL